MSLGWLAAASARLCVETTMSINVASQLAAAASARLCVETAGSYLDAPPQPAAASARLCVETIELEMRGRFGESSRLRAAVC